MDGYSELYEFLYKKIDLIKSDLENIKLNPEEELPDRLEHISKKLQNISDHTLHEMEDLKPQDKNDNVFVVTDEFCQEVYRAMLEAQNFSIGFIQRRFLIGYSVACEVKKKLAENLIKYERLCRNGNKIYVENEDFMMKEWVKQLQDLPNYERKSNSFSALKKKVKAGAIYRFGKIDQKIKNRISYELSIIRKTCTASLFLYYYQTIKKIKTITFPYVYSVQNCSLVCYCLGVTEVNPLKTGSYFERLLNSLSEFVPVLFVSVAEEKKEEVCNFLGDTKKIIEIQGEADVLDISAENAERFLNKQRFDDKIIIQKAVSSFGERYLWFPETIAEFADWLVLCRYAKVNVRKQVVTYQEDAVALFLHFGFSYEQAEDLRKSFAKKMQNKIDQYRKLFYQNAEENNVSAGLAEHIFQQVEQEINYTVCRAAYVAKAQYLYMKTWFQEENAG